MRRKLHVFMGDDKKFILAEDHRVLREHIRHWDDRRLYRVRLIVNRKRPYKFYSRDGRHYWEVHARVELDG